MVTRPGRAGGLDRLGGVAHEVRQHPEELVGVGATFIAAGTSASKPAQAAGAACPLVLEHLGTSGRSAKAVGTGGSSSALPKASVRSQRLIARDSERDQLRHRARAPPGSALVSMRSAMICAVASMLRRSWLILATALPSPASRSFCFSAAVSRSSRSCSAASAWRSSRAPLSGAMIRLASSGSSR